MAGPSDFFSGLNSLRSKTGVKRGKGTTGSLIDRQLRKVSNHCLSKGERGAEVPESSRGRDQTPAGESVPTILSALSPRFLH